MEFNAILNEEGLRSACIENKWYTKGNSAQYEEMFKVARDISFGGIERTAKNIKEHSNTTDTAEFIAMWIYKYCITRWVK